MGNCYKAYRISKSSGRVTCNVKALQNEVGKEETTEDGKPEEGKSNELLAKICYCIRQDHKADTLIHNIHVKDSLSDSITFQQEKWGWNSPQLITQKISHMSFVGHNSQESCCRVLSIWKKNCINNSEHNESMLYDNLSIWQRQPEF